MDQQRKHEAGNFKFLSGNERRQLLIFSSISLVIALFVIVLLLEDHQFFQKYFGSLNPLLVIFLTSLTGVAVFTFLIKRRWLVIYDTITLKGRLTAAVFAFLFALGVILVDIFSGFPKDISLLPPQSFLFYPAVGFVVEIFFHCLPMAILLGLLFPLSKKIGYKKILWLSILVVAFLEPVYQPQFSLADSYSPWLTGYVFLHIFLINLSQLYLFKKYDFITMYLLRLVYYLFWHIIWGYFRLSLLF